MAGYVPSPEQQKRCRKCKYWGAMNGAKWRCCHYLLIEGRSRGGDPCQQYAPKKRKREDGGHA